MKLTASEKLVYAAAFVLARDKLHSTPETAARAGYDAVMALRNVPAARSDPGLMLELFCEE